MTEFVTPHCINEPGSVIKDALCGVAHLNQKVRYHPDVHVILRRDIDEWKQTHVPIIATSGGGHEPMFSGFVGENFASGYVSGQIFAAPTSSNCLAAIKVCQSPLGVILFTANYTGDILNCGLAITRAKALGINCELVVVGDDVAVGRSKGGKVGRRGLSGHLSVLKMGGEMSEEGKSLVDIVEAMRFGAERLGTIACAFDRCALPSGLTTKLPTLPANTIELGLGAHGEPGLEQISPIPEPKVLVKRMISLFLSKDPDRDFVDVASGDSVLMIVNNLGSSSSEALTSFAYLAIQELEANGIQTVRVAYGPLVTSLKMSGFGISIFRLARNREHKSLTAAEMIRLWDKDCGALCWPNGFFIQ